MYKINQNVLIRYGGKGKKASKTQHVCIAKIEKVVNMICTKLILEIYLIIKRFPFGFQRLPEELTAQIYSYLEANPNDPNGTWIFHSSTTLIV